MAKRGIGQLQRLLGWICVVSGAALITAGFNSIVVGCAEGPAFANSEEAVAAATAAADQDSQADLAGAAAPEPSDSGSQADPGEDAATASSESTGNQEEQAPAAGQSEAPEPAAQQGPRRPRGRGGSRSPAEQHDKVADQVPHAGVAESQGQVGDGRDGFTALESGWPASLDNSMDGSTADAEQQLAANTPLSEEARGFAGRWVAAVINKDGAARLLSSEDEWVFNLGLDARCSARQKLDGRFWEQSGWWQLQGDTLTLSLGPGGVWVFGLQREGDDIAVWSRAMESEDGPRFTLFCVRTPAGRMPAGLAGRYNSDFGPLRFEPSGPGHWRASYGDPQGKLSVARVGGFLAGKWEQQPGLGFVLFRLNTAQSTGQNKGGPGAASAIDGVWWYAGSTSFDGRWSATQAK